MHTFVGLFYAYIFIANADKNDGSAEGREYVHASVMQHKKLVWLPSPTMYNNKYSYLNACDLCVNMICIRWVRVPTSPTATTMFIWWKQQSSRNQRRVRWWTAKNELWLIGYEYKTCLMRSKARDATIYSLACERKYIVRRSHALSSAKYMLCLCNGPGSFFMNMCVILAKVRTSSDGRQHDHLHI